MFSARDIDALGVRVSDQSVEYVCTSETVVQGLCSTDDYGTVLIDPNRHLSEPIFIDRVEVPSGRYFTYDIPSMGRYCVATIPYKYCLG